MSLRDTGMQLDKLLGGFLFTFVGWLVGFSLVFFINLKPRLSALLCWTF